MKECDRHCVVMFDEIFLRGRLSFNPSKNIVEGFENYGDRGRTNFIANHALVFMVQGVHHKWTQPIAYYFVSKTCPTTMLKLLIQDVVRAVLSVGLNVLATVSDQGPNNRGAISELRQQYGDNIFYSVDNHRLVHVWDMPHIIKNVRNNLLSSNLEFDDGKVAKWRHLIEYYKQEELWGCKISSLTLKHLNPQGRDKMRVSYATKVFSTSTANCMETVLRASDFAVLSGCSDFVALCRDIDKFFDLCNGPRANEPADVNHKYRVNVNKNSVHHEEWNTIFNKLSKWTYIRKKDGTRHVPFCVKGWMENIKAFKYLWCKVKDLKMKVLKLRHFNEDALENLFCLIRQCGGCSSDLTWEQFTSALKTCLITRFTTLVTDKKILDDDSFLMSDLREYLTESEHEVTTANSPSTTETLQRGDTPATTRKESATDQSLQRQGPTLLWSSAVASITKEIKCDQCVKKLTTTEKSIDTTFCLMTSSFDLFPSREIVSVFLNLLAEFEKKWKRLLHKSDVTEIIQSFCEGVVDKRKHFCADHLQDSNVWSVLGGKMVSNLMHLKINQCNQNMKKGVVRRSRQVLDFKNSLGLHVSEEAAQIHHHDLQLLMGPQSLQGSLRLFHFLCLLASYMGWFYHKCLLGHV